ncbi:MAG: hypothetical protein EB163_09030 [Nitrososphaeria archaeon]|nr:hypothetical protein [Nitrososphaeria archaeon]
MQVSMTNTMSAGTPQFGSVIAPPNGYLYISGNNGLQAFDRTTNLAVGVPTLTGIMTFGTAYNPDNQYIYAAEWTASSVGVVDVSTNTVAGTIPVGSNPFGVLFNPANRSIYVSNLSSNTISVIPIPAAPSTLYCDGMTIPQLIASGTYNVIDNTSGALGTRIKGTSHNDLIILSSITNHVQGMEGDDCIIGGTGDDRISGGTGNDQIFGGSGNDHITGRADNDKIFGGLGNDVISGGLGNDSVSGDEDNDVVLGREGDDSLSGGSGTDYCYDNSGANNFDLSCEVHLP